MMLRNTIIYDILETNCMWKTQILHAKYKQQAYVTQPEKNNKLLGTLERWEQKNKGTVA